MKILDIIFLIILLIGAYRGYVTGLFLEIVTFLAFILAIISAFKLLHTAMYYIRSELGWESVLLPYISFLIIFCLVFFGIFFLSKGLKKIMDFTILGKADSFIGALLGIGKMAFAISLILWITKAASVDMPKDLINESILYAPLVELAPGIVHYMSQVIPFQDIFPAISDLLTRATT